MSKHRVIAALFVVVLLAGCSFPGPFSIAGSGRIVTETYDLDGFDRVEASHSFAVDITQGDGYQVTVDVDDNMVEHLRVVKMGDTLKLGLEPGRAYNLSGVTLRARVRMPELVGLELSGASQGDVSGFESTQTFDAGASGASSLRGDLESGDARFDVSGASNVDLRGTGADLWIDASGASSVRLDDFAVNNASIQASGASRIEVNVSGRLDAEASGASDIRYVGDPTLGRTQTSGASSIGPK